MAMDAVLVTIANGGRAIIVIDIEHRGSRNILSTRSIYPLKVAQPNPHCRGSWEWGMFVHQNHVPGGGNSLSWWGCLWAVCFASQKPLDREFLVPAGMDSAKLLNKQYLAKKVIVLSSNIL